MTVIKETKHVLDNLFYLQPGSKFYAYLLENAKLGLSLMDYIISGKEMRGENSSLFKMSDYEACFIDQLNDYEDFCQDNNINMDTYFPLLECTKEDFDRFKRGEPCEPNYQKPPHITNQLDSEPSPSINQFFHQIMDPSDITNGEGVHLSHVQIVLRLLIRK